MLNLSVYRSVWLVCFSLVAACSVTLLQAQEDDVQTAEAKPQAENEGDENLKGAVYDEFPLADLPPLRRLVLYNSGVGQLQHEGKAIGRQRFEIKFSSHDVDDVIKSLVFSDDGDGAVRAVEYQPAPEPEDVAANTVGIPMTLAQLLQRFRGESVTLTVNGSDQTGIVYGVEHRPDGENVTEVVVLLTDDGLRSIDLPNVDRIQFEKEELRKTLMQAMQGVVKSRKANQKTLELLFDGEGERNVKFGYVVDMPIWRMTYRLSILENKVYLQGWAHVDNVTGVDWEQVDLELRSGRPQSFHINIFAPLMAERPDFGNAVYDFTEGLILVTQWFGFEPPARFGASGGTRSSNSGGGGFGGGGLFGGGGGSRSRRGNSTGGNPAAGVDMDSAFRQAAQSSRASKMVRYVLDKPVDLGAGRSAALPVFSKEVPAQLLSVYDELEQRQHPYRTIQVTNKTDLSMVSGPISIMDEGTFVGDGKLNRLDVDQKAEIVFGLDPAVEISSRDLDLSDRLQETGELVLTLDENKGIVQSWNSVRKRIFTIKNRDTEPRTLILYCQRAGKEETMEPPSEGEPDERVIFKLNLEAKSTQEFELTFTRPRQETLLLDGPTARRVLRQPSIKIEDSERQVLTQLVELEDRLAESVSKKNALNEQRKELVTDQNRVRDNLRVLSDNPEVSQPFLDKLQTLENQIDELRQSIRDNRVEFDDLLKQQKAVISDYFDK